MNKRIKELLEQAGVIFVVIPKDTEYEMFAELILADVIAIIEDPQSYNRCVFTNFDANQSRCVAVELVKEINQKLKDVK